MTLTQVRLPVRRLTATVGRVGNAGGARRTWGWIAFFTVCPSVAIGLWAATLPLLIDWFLLKPFPPEYDPADRIAERIFRAFELGIYTYIAVWGLFFLLVALVVPADYTSDALWHDDLIVFVHLIPVAVGATQFGVGVAVIFGSLPLETLWGTAVAWTLLTAGILLALQVRAPGRSRQL